MTTQLYTLRDVARITASDEKTVRRRIAAGDLRAIRLGPRLIRVTAEDLDKFLAAQKIA